ncbi:MAG TPA: lytic transglycosylase domain-containing protein [Anaeromyxobacteraceae bacterium]|nr:lytic transglycosylase domain-containing protein [Anaeromyxobacteraceae bacterium]
MRRRSRRGAVRRLARAWHGLSGAGRAVAAFALLSLLTIAYQVVRKPTELLAVVPSAAKTPAQTWAAYGELFREDATGVVAPELLAALVQVESAGDPLARTFWRFRWRANPLDLYGPASSAVGLLQMTDGTFAEARQLCIHDHRVVRAGPWQDPGTCWFNGTYVRWRAADAIEMTSAWLDQRTREVLGARLGRTPPDRRLRLAAVVHLCGPGRGLAYARRGFRALPRERCGEHDLAAYVARVAALAGEFERLARDAP